MDLPCEMLAIQYSLGRRVGGDGNLSLCRALDQSSKR